jgi:hypothetical protein
MPSPTWATDRVSAAVEAFVRHRDSVSAREIANELKIGHQLAESTLNELQKRGVVGRPGAEGRSQVLRRGDIGILTRQRTEELLSLLKDSRYESRLQPNRVILFNRETDSEDTFFELYDLEFFCRNQESQAKTGDGNENRQSDLQKPFEPDGHEQAAAFSAFQSRVSQLERAIADLRVKGKRAVADRDHWEAHARQLETENHQLKTSRGDAKFRALKVAITRICHPDNYSSSGRIEALARAELFKELWAELEKIERQS